tara:strand:+ start:651 stop:893 length:243 start_codon:yes stop_codon:yes gene_type:complete
MAILPQSPGFKFVTDDRNNHSQEINHHATKAMATQIPSLPDDRREVCCKAKSFATMLQCNTTESAVNVRAESYLMREKLQ